MSIKDRIRNCRKCQKYIKKCNPLVFGDIINSKFVFISEEPTQEASTNDFFQYYLKDKLNRFHSEWMPKMGITIDWLKKYPYITHIYKCCSGYSTKQKGKRDKELKGCLAWFNEEKTLFNNKTIVAIGKYALKNLVPELLKSKGYLKLFKEIDINKLPLVNNSSIIPIPHPSSNNNGPIKENSDKLNKLFEYIKKKIEDIEYLTK